MARVQNAISNRYFIKDEKKYTWVVRKWSQSVSGAPTVLSIGPSCTLTIFFFLPNIICIIWQFFFTFYPVKYCIKGKKMSNLDGKCLQRSIQRNSMPAIPEKVLRIGFKNNIFSLPVHMLCRWKVNDATFVKGFNLLWPIFIEIFKVNNKVLV